MKRFIAVFVALAIGLLWAGVGQAQSNPITRFDMLKADGSSACSGPAAQRVCTIPSGSKEFSIVVDYQNLPDNTKLSVELADAAGNKLAPPAETHGGNGSVTWKVTGDQVLANLRALADPDQQGLVSKVQAVKANPSSPQERETLSEAQQVVSGLRKPVQSLQRYEAIVPGVMTPLSDADAALAQALQALSANGTLDVGKATTAANTASGKIKEALDKLKSQTNIALADDIPAVVTNSAATRTLNIEVNNGIAQTLAWTVSSYALPTSTPQPTGRPVATEMRPGNVPTRTPTTAPTQNSQQPTATTAPAQNNQQPTATTAPVQNSQQPTATTAPVQNSQPTATPAVVVPQAATAPAVSAQAASGQSASGQAASGTAAQAASGAAKTQSGGASVVTAAPPPPGSTAAPVGAQPASGAGSATPAAAQKTVGAAPAGATPNATARAAGTAAPAGAPATATAAKLAGGVDLSRLTPEAGGASRVLGQTDRGGLPLLMMGLVVVAAALGGAALWMRRRM